MKRHLKDDSKLLKGLIEVQAVIGPIPVNHDNPFAETRYLDLPGILTVAKPELSKHGILMQQTADVFQNDKGTQVRVTTELLNAEGEYIRCDGTLGATEMHKSNPTQKLGASISYLRRFQAMAILGIAGSEDDDETDFSADTPPAQAPVEINGPTPNEQRQQIIDAISEKAKDAVFSDHDRSAIRASIQNARTLEQLQQVLADVDAAYNDKIGGMN
jgi:hypothetical protein